MVRIWKKDAKISLGLLQDIAIMNNNNKEILGQTL